jgi:hypothetical protein
MTMSIKQIINKVGNHLLKQNAKSIDSDNACRYRGDNGMSCAIGCLLPDEMYDPLIEGKGVVSDILKARLKHVVGVKNSSRIQKLTLLGELQNLHDMYFVEHWPEELAKLKIEYGIS